MASVEAGTRRRGGQRIQPLPRPNPPQRLAGILLREHDEDLDRLGGFLASTPDARTASEETVGDACGTGCRGWPSAWPARWPRLVGWLASRTRWLPTSRGLLHPRNRVPGRCGRHPDATLAIRGLSVGARIGRIARREARSPDCSSAAFSRPRCCPISWLWHDPTRRRRRHPD
jgi:magnesium transporter